MAVHQRFFLTVPVYTSKHLMMSIGSALSSKLPNCERFWCHFKHRSQLKANTLQKPIPIVSLWILTRILRQKYSSTKRNFMNRRYSVFWKKPRQIISVGCRILSFHCIRLTTVCTFASFTDVCCALPIMYFDLVLSMNEDRNISIPNRAIRRASGSFQHLWIGRMVLVARCGRKVRHRLYHKMRQFAWMSVSSFFQPVFQSTNTPTGWAYVAEHR